MNYMQTPDFTSSLIIYIASAIKMASGIIKLQVV